MLKSCRQTTASNGVDYKIADNVNTHKKKVKQKQWAKVMDGGGDVSGCVGGSRLPLITLLYIHQHFLIDEMKTWFSKEWRVNERQRDFAFEMEWILPANRMRWWRWEWGEESDGVGEGKQKKIGVNKHHLSFMRSEKRTEERREIFSFDAYRRAKERKQTNLWHKHKLDRFRWNWKKALARARNTKKFKREWMPECTHIMPSTKWRERTTTAIEEVKKTRRLTTTRQKSNGLEWLTEWAHSVLHFPFPPVAGDHCVARARAATISNKMLQLCFELFYTLTLALTTYKMYSQFTVSFALIFCSFFFWFSFFVFAALSIHAHSSTAIYLETIHITQFKCNYKVDSITRPLISIYSAAVHALSFDNLKQMLNFLIVYSLVLQFSMRVCSVRFVSIVAMAMMMMMIMEINGSIGTTKRTFIPLVSTIRTNTTDAWAIFHLFFVYFIEGFAREWFLRVVFNCVVEGTRDGNFNGNIDSIDSNVITVKWCH